jgi:AAA ATPase-like protein
MKQTNTSGDWARYARMTREERLQAFKRRTIEHPHLLVAGQALHDVIREPGGASLIFVCGPAGVGKTTLKNYVIEATTTEMMFASLMDEEHPILTMLARPPLNATFGWRDFLQSGLLAVKELPDQRMALYASNDEEHSRVDLPKESRTKRRSAKGMKEDDLRLSLETAIKRCHPMAVIVDDAQHLGKVSGSR